MGFCPWVCAAHQTGTLPVCIFLTKLILIMGVLIVVIFQMFLMMGIFQIDPFGLLIVSRIRDRILFKKNKTVTQKPERDLMSH